MPIKWIMVVTIRPTDKDRQTDHVDHKTYNNSRYQYIADAAMQLINNNNNNNDLTI